MSFCVGRRPLRTARGANILITATAAATTSSDGGAPTVAAVSSNGGRWHSDRTTALQRQRRGRRAPRAGGAVATAMVVAVARSRWWSDVPIATGAAVGALAGVTVGGVAGVNTDQNVPHRTRNESRRGRRHRWRCPERAGARIRHVATCREAPLQVLYLCRYLRVRVRAGQYLQFSSSFLFFLTIFINNSTSTPLKSPFLCFTPRKTREHFLFSRARPASSSTYDGHLHCRGVHPHGCRAAGI